MDVKGPMVQVAEYLHVLLSFIDSCLIGNLPQLLFVIYYQIKVK